LAARVAALKLLTKLAGRVPAAGCAPRACTGSVVGRRHKQMTARRMTLPRPLGIQISEGQGHVGDGWMDPALHDLARSVLELVRGLAHLVIDSPMTALLLW